MKAHMCSFNCGFETIWSSAMTKHVQNKHVKKNGNKNGTSVDLPTWVLETLTGEIGLHSRNISKKY